MSRFTIESARQFLFLANVFLYNDVESEIAGLKRAYGVDKWTVAQDADWRREIVTTQQTLNLNDVWGWAVADCYHVPDAELVECAELMWQYGWAGILYFVSSKTDWQRSEFYDVNRAIDFVKHEEELRKSCKSSSELAYKKVAYTLGVSP